MLVKFLGTQYCLYTKQKILSLKLKGKLQITLVLTLTALTLRELCNNSRACVVDQSVGNTLHAFLITVCQTLSQARKSAVKYGCDQLITIAVNNNNNNNNDRLTAFDPGQHG